MITYQIISKTGSRPVNEDCTGMHEKNGAYGFFLADGLGGHGKGEVASQAAVEQAIMQFEAYGYRPETLSKIFEAGQAAVLAKQEQQGAQRAMKTTMTALLVGPQRICFGHIGDSRIYCFQNGRLVSRTIDHSVPQMLAIAGEIKEHQIRYHPDRNRLLRVMGIDWEGSSPYTVSGEIPRSPKQAFLLCSDGFWELIDEKEMCTALKRSKTAGEWLDRMEALVVSHGCGKDMDNYSAIAVWIGE